MTTTEIVLAVFSVVSALVSFISFYRTEVQKATEQANIDVMKERLNSMYLGLRGLHFIADKIVQAPKSRDLKIEEVQDLARVMRDHIRVYGNQLIKDRKALNEWNHGARLRSDPPDEKLELQVQEAEDATENIP